MKYEVKNIIGIIASALLLLARTSFAQLAPVSDDISIKLSPKFPGPNEKVEIEAVSFSFDTKSALFSWFINGKLTLSGKGKDSVSFLTGSLGSRTTILVSAQSFEGKLLEKTFVLNIGELHLLWSADTYTPP